MVSPQLPESPAGFASMSLVEEQNGRGLQDERLPESTALMADIVFRHPRVAVTLAVVGARLGHGGASSCVF